MPAGTLLAGLGIGIEDPLLGEASMFAASHRENALGLIPASTIPFFYAVAINISASESRKVSIQRPGSAKSNYHNNSAYLVPHTASWTLNPGLGNSA